MIELNTRKLYVLLALFLSFESCSPKYLPFANEFQNYHKGAVIKIKTGEQEFVGEILAINDDKLLIKDFNASLGSLELRGPAHEIIEIIRDSIAEARIMIAKATPNEKITPILAIINFILPFTHDVAAIFTLPAAALMNTGSVFLHKGKYFFFDYPRDISWERIEDFARFPGGIPEHINLEMIK